MTTTRFFDWFQIAALGCLASFGIGRAIVLYTRGVRVVVIDWERSVPEKLADLLVMSLLLSWAYETVAWAWPLRKHIFPAPLSAVVVDFALVKGAGAVAVLCGLLIFALALWAFADSWRIGIDRQTAGALMTRGIFAWTRNPIYIALDLIVCGTFLVSGRVIFLVIAVGFAGLLHYQIRREERYLAGAYGDAYRDYCERVGRYVRWRG
jgi:protein-S-isoprenylcysteine O-methyltransferase Ste14